MKRVQNLFFPIIFSVLLSANLNANSKTAKVANGLCSPGEKERIILLSTDYGDIKIKLYNETPLHRDNIIKLASEHFYDSLSFHRVINGFMIQGGDPMSKKADKNQTLGNGGPKYTIPAEFKPELFHKKGALAAAREGDNVNPEKRSSGSQFYLVQGKVYTSQELDVMESRMNEGKKVELMRACIMKPENLKMKQRIDSLQKAQNQEELNIMIKDLENIIAPDLKNVQKFSFSKEQREAYTTVGGTPHLDGGYTVFGEVIEGLDVIDKIAAVETGANDRPVKDVKMKITVLN